MGGVRVGAPTVLKRSAGEKLRMGIVYRNQELINGEEMARIRSDNSGSN